MLPVPPFTHDPASSLEHCQGSRRTGPPLAEPEAKMSVMVRRVSPSQFRSQMRQAVSRAQRSIDAYNRGVRQVVNKYNQAVSRHNQAVRSHNARVRTARSNLSQALARVQNQARKARYERYTSSAYVLHASFERLELRIGTDPTPEQEALLGLSEQETANSLDVAAAFASDGSTEGVEGYDALGNSAISDELTTISTDLGGRWRGALFALHPSNPDAARHFCTSSREIIDGILDIKAPKEVVGAAVPACDRTRDGSPTRRSRIRFLLLRRGVPEAEEFVEQDLDDIVELFGIFNAGMHGPAGRFKLQELVAVKRRVEDGIRFLMQLAA